MSDPVRIACRWGTDGSASPIHHFDFPSGGASLPTLHGPDGKDYPNQSRFMRLVAGQLLEVEHLSGHHFILTIVLQPSGGASEVYWRQTFDTVQPYGQIAEFEKGANKQNLRRLAADALNSRDAA